jgi:hypothetical protein
MSLDLKRKQLELARVEVARQEQEFKIDEYKEQIERLQKTIQIQVATEEKLKQEIKQLKGE